MTYVWEAGKRHRVMHIQRYSSSGTPLAASLCGIDHRFNRSINAPFSLGRKVCKRCRHIAARSAEDAA